MENNVFGCIRVLESWEQRILLTLNMNGCLSDTIEFLVAEYESDSLIYDETSELPHSLPESTFYAISALSSIRNLIFYLNDQLGHGIMSAEFTETAVVNAFQAGLLAGKFLPNLSIEAYKREYDTKGIIAVTQKALDGRHQPLREFKKNAAAAMKAEWESGSNLNHHQMAKFMAYDYVDSKGKHPFDHLSEKDRDGNFKSSENVLRKVAKAVATEIGRRDLVSGLKKITS